MKIRVAAVFAALVAVVLVGTVAHPAALTQPYADRTPSYAVAHDSTDAFDEVVAEAALDPEAATSMDDLSPETRRAFDEMTEQPREAGDQYRAAGWQSHDGITRCDENLRVCDEYEALPEFPADGHTGGYETYGVVESDDGRYVVETESGPALGFPIETVFKAIAFLPYALLLGLAGSARSRLRDTETAALAAVGLVLAGAAFAHPYLVMFDYLPPVAPVFFVIGATWLALLAGITLHVRRDEPAAVNRAESSR